MGLFGDKSKRSWQRLSFSKKQTKAGILAKEESRSQRYWRLGLAVLFAAFVTAVVGSCLPESATTWTAWLAVAGLVFVVHLLMLLLVRAYHRHIFDALPTYLVVMGLFILTGRLMLIPEIELGFVVPLPCFAMIIALGFGGPLAIHSALANAVILGLMIAVGGVEDSAPLVSLPAGVVLSQFLGSVVAILGVTRIRTRTRLVTIGIASGAAQALAIAVYSFSGVGAMEFTVDTMIAGEWLHDPAWGFLNGLGSGIVLTSLLPFLERWLDLTTDMRLLELADQNRPLLRELSLLAPGSFQHSLMVGQLAEEAANSIGANDLLARVGALYHDIGKMLKPNYFVENNQAGEENIHDRLSPEMSRLIIISHVKDGIRIAEEERLPRPIKDMIPMHHGTSVVEYFFYKKRKQEEDKGLGETGEEAFRYPGPKPTFKEAGILMLADTVEAISRVIENPTRARLRGIVKEVINKKMAAGQLDDCELTMNDLHRIEDAFVRVLSSIHHGRVKYPTKDGIAAPGEDGEGDHSPVQGESDSDSHGGDDDAKAKSSDAASGDPTADGGKGNDSESGGSKPGDSKPGAAKAKGSANGGKSAESRKGLRETTR
ncbi:MAG: HDIG domain-containing metalloprotein [Planctomycetota bacterium]